MKPLRLSPDEYQICGIRPGDARSACVWEYGRESRLLRETFYGVFTDTTPFTLETSFLSIIRFGMGPEIFLQLPWVKVAAIIRRKIPSFRKQPIQLEHGVYPVQLVTGVIAVQQVGHYVIKISAYEDLRDVLHAVARIHKNVRRRLPSTALRGRSSDWLARIEWLGMYRLRRAGYTYRDIALFRAPGAKDTNLESEIRQVKRGVSRVPHIFHELFPFLPLSELIGTNIEG